MNLSGGEKQRLALARGLLAADKAAAQILLLDEPTSSVDSKNEQQIYTNVFRRYPDCAVVSAVHRLHLLTMFDTVILLDAGSVVASGVRAFALFL